MKNVSGKEKKKTNRIKPRKGTIVGPLIGYGSIWELTGHNRFTIGIHQRRQEVIFY